MTVTPRVVPYATHEGDTAVWFTNNPDKWNVRKRNGVWWIYPPYARSPEASTAVFPSHYTLCLKWIEIQRHMDAKAIPCTCSAPDYQDENCWTHGRYAQS